MNYTPFGYILTMVESTSKAFRFCGPIIKTRHKTWLLLLVRILELARDTMFYARFVILYDIGNFSWIAMQKIII